MERGRRPPKATPRTSVSASRALQRCPHLTLDHTGSYCPAGKGAKTPLRKCVGSKAPHFPPFLQSKHQRVQSLFERAFAYKPDSPNSDHSHDSAARPALAKAVLGLRQPQSRE